MKIINIPCKTCGDTKLPLHYNRECPNCFTEPISEQIAEALLRRSQAIADAVKSLQADEARTKRNQVARMTRLPSHRISANALAIRALQLVKADRLNKTGGK